ncbi:MAG: SagB/ThcOx family dehydrogenase [Dehalococcoidia bacterium]|nr:SagB/ThcOx family dehydrogenase [Dehalococcoidia bacterium]
MTNRDVEAAWSYHDGTKHSWQSIHSDSHFLDFPNQPLPFKVYEELEPLPLPRDFSNTGVEALSAIAGRVGGAGDGELDLRGLASVLYYSAGITKKGAYPGGEILFRAAACTGALYHVEVYLVCGPLAGLEPGVYHFGAHDFALRRLRRGDYRAALVEACGYEPSVASAPASLVLTSTFWRNSWKYRARAYRHCFWDSGTMLANTLAVSTARGIEARVVAGFADGAVNHLLGLDTEREVSLAVVPLGKGSPGCPAPPPMPDLDLKTAPLSPTEVEYPAIGAIHSASSLATGREARAWRASAPGPSTKAASGPLKALQSLADGAGDTIEGTIARRGSSRQFRREAVTLPQLSTILHRSTQGIPADFLEPPGAMLNRIYLIVHAVDGLASGAYVYRREEGALELLDEGEMRRVAGFLGLQQALPADASVDVFMLADLPEVLDRYGNRGYRAAQLEGGIVGGKMYLAAYAQRLGATGLTFFDDDVTEFFSPDALGLSTMFLVALGKPARRRSRR